MKNSSRLVAEIERKRSRSRSGWLAFADSSNTLSMYSISNISRLINHAGEDERGCNLSFAAVTPVDDACCSFFATAGAKQISFSSMNYRSNHSAPQAELKRLA